MEEWVDLCKVIEGLEPDNYHISNKGTIKSIARVVVRKNGAHNPVKDRILKGSLNIKTRYHTVNLQINKVCQSFYIHRLVVLAFLENKDNKREVNHKDGIKTNNTIENLEWVTSSENKFHAVDNDLHGMAYSTEFKEALLKRYLNNKEDTVTKLSIELGPSRPTIHSWIRKAKEKGLLPES